MKLSVSNTPFLLLAFVLCFGVSNAQFTVGGDASALGGGCYQLTPAQNSQAGYVYQNAPVDLNQPFDMMFSVYLGTNNGGADGIVFVFKDSLIAPFIGTGGGSLGFNGTGFTESVGIEVDTWFNGGNGDLNADHIGMLSNGSVDHAGVNGLAGPIQASATNANVEDGNWHFLNVAWDPQAQELTVYLDCEERLTYNGDIINNIFNGDASVYWGFLGTTGGANNQQQFCFTTPIDSLVTTLEDTNICAGEAVTLQAGNMTPTYTWNNGGSLSSTTIPNPVATPTATTTYIVTATHACDTIIDTAIVTIDPPDFTLSSNVTNPSCFGDCDGSIDLVVNGTGNYNYQWSTGPVSEDLVGLCDGTYQVTVSENTGCTEVSTIVVTEPTVLVASTANQTKTSCPGTSSCDASADASAMGGTPPYSFLWSSNETSPSAGALCPDSNHVTITDANGCVDVAGLDILIPDSIITIGNGDTLICISQMPPVSAASTGGTPPFSYEWRQGGVNGNLISIDAGLNVSPEVTTTYYIQSTDANGCVGDTTTVTVRVRPPLGVMIDQPDTICPYDAIDIEAMGTGGDSNYLFTWESGDFTPITNVSPDESTWLNITVSDVCGTPSYEDSVFIQVGGYSPIRVNLRADDDSLCIGEETFLAVGGVGGHNGPNEYRYQWEHDNDTTNLLFVRPRSHQKYLVTVSDLCLSEPGTDSLIVYVKEPVTPKIVTFPESSCAKAEVTYVPQPWSPNYRYDWVLGDGSGFASYPEDTLRHSFQIPGCYDTWLKVEDDFGCVTQAYDPCGVRVLNKPVADFTSDLPYATTQDPLMTYRDQSEGAHRIMWVINFDTIYDTEVIKEAIYSDWGQKVKLIAEAPSGCQDTVVKQFELIEVQSIHLPSSFTPNGDGRNDTYKVYGEQIDHEGFDLSIYDRWGQQVFRTTNPHQAWDGKSINGQRAPIGVYTVILQYRDGAGKKKLERHTVTISKTNEQKF